METVLITGPTSGIGYELGKLFAQDGYNMVLVSRNEEQLKKTAEEFKSLGAGSIEIIPCDLSIAGGAQTVCDATCQKNIEVDILVNDAGVGEHGLFTQTSLDKELSIIQLNIISLVHLTKFYLQEMVKRNRGKILQLASIAAYQPTPLLAVYSATKAFVLSFTDSLINEVKDTNVTITALIPGPTDTDFFNKANAQNTVAAQNAKSPAEVAKAGYEGLMEGKHHAVAPGMKNQVIMSSLLPNEQVTAMARKQMEDVDGKKKEHHIKEGEDEIAYLRRDIQNPK
ncbi:MAG: SDR family oxidoreductase [Chitinophagales bacterium]